MFLGAKKLSVFFFMEQQWNKGLKGLPVVSGQLEQITCACMSDEHMKGEMLLRRPYINNSFVSTGSKMIRNNHKITLSEDYEMKGGGMNSEKNRCGAGKILLTW